MPRAKTQPSPEENVLAQSLVPTVAVTAAQLELLTRIADAQGNTVEEHLHEAIAVYLYARYGQVV